MARFPIHSEWGSFHYSSISFYIYLGVKTSAEHVVRTNGHEWWNYYLGTHALFWRNLLGSSKALTFGAMSWGRLIGSVFDQIFVAMTSAGHQGSQHKAQSWMWQFSSVWGRIHLGQTWLLLGWNKFQLQSGFEPKLDPWHPFYLSLLLCNRLSSCIALSRTISNP